MTHRRMIAALGVLLLVAAACGGADDEKLYGSGTGGAGSGGVSGSSAGTGATAGGGAAGASGGSAGAAGGGAAGSGGSAGVATGGSGGGTGGSAGTSAGGTGGSGGASGVGTGTCGSAICAFVAGDACCHADNTPLHCSNAKLNNPCECKGIACGKVELYCDGSEDCAGKLCCAETNWFGTKYDAVSCKETCKSDQPVGVTRREVCHPGGVACTNGSPCTADPKLPPGYGTCAP